MARLFRGGGFDDITTTGAGFIESPAAEATGLLIRPIRSTPLNAPPNEAIDSKTTPAADPPLIPPRFWWLKRISIAIAAVVIMFAGLFLWAEYRSRALLNSRIAEWKAAGQPIDPQDFNRKTRLPDERNAAKLYNDAAAAFTWPADIDSTLNLDDVMDLDKHLDEARKVVAANQPMLDLMRRASELEEADWGLSVTSPIVVMGMPSLTGARNCAKVCGLAAKVAARDGNPNDSIQNLRDSLRLGDSLRQHPVTLVKMLNSTAIDSFTLSVAEQMIGNLYSIDESPNQRGALRRMVHLLTEYLLGENDIQESWRMTMQLERASCMDAGAMLANGSLSPAAMMGRPPPRIAAPLYHVWRIAARPIWRCYAVRAADRLTKFAEINVDAPYGDTQRWLAKISAIEMDNHILTAAMSPMWSVSAPHYDRIIQGLYQNLALRRMAACALAIRMYEWDHGRRPTRLEELVPDYLPRVPVDPFDPDAGLIRYMPDAIPARLYSVSVNETDEGGAYALFSRGGINWREKDLVFRLEPELNDNESSD